MIQKTETALSNKEEVIYKITLTFFYFYARLRLPPETNIYTGEVSYHFQFYRNQLDNNAKGYYHTLTVKIKDETAKFIYFFNDSIPYTSPVAELLHKDFVACIKSQQFMKFIERVINEYIFSNEIQSQSPK